MISNKLFSFLYVVFLLFLSLMVFSYGVSEFFSFFDVPLMDPIFADVRTIAGVNETLSLGLDPMVSNPGDPWGRPMNYPRVWVYFARLTGLNKGGVVFFGLVNIALFVFGMYMFLISVNKTLPIVLSVFLLMLSPSVMLLVERGNIDMLVFFLLAIMVFFRRQPIASFLLLSLATIVKIFPIFAAAFSVSYLSVSFKRFLFFFASFLVFSLFVFLFSYDDLIKIKEGTPMGVSFSYGLGVIPYLIRNKFEVDVEVFFYIFVFVCFTALIFYKVRGIPFLKNDVVESSELSYFRVGAAVYVFTFLASHNWDYRLTFLLFTIPFLWGLFWKESLASKFFAATAIFSIFVSFNVQSAYSSNYYIFIDEVFNWVLFFSMSVLLLKTMPDNVFFPGCMFRRVKKYGK